jgi:biopolymer transport protein ExbB
METVVLQTIRQGGWIMYPIIASSMVVWWMGLWKLYTVWRFGMARKRFFVLWGEAPHASRTSHGTGDCRYDGLLEYGRSGRITAAAFNHRFREFLLEVREDMNDGFSTIAVWISVAPLLGLLGTVVGMIATFKVITIFGAGNPSLTAEGISIALLTTEAGLTVAFPGMLLYTFVKNRKNGLLRRVRSDGTRLVARLPERQESKSNRNDDV